MASFNLQQQTGQRTMKAMVMENAKELREQLESHSDAVHEQLSRSAAQPAPERGPASSETWAAPNHFGAQTTPPQPQMFNVHTDQSDADRTAAADALATKLLTAPAVRVTC